MTSIDKHKFETLDAMRGVAAVCVMLFHFRKSLPGIGFARLFESGNLAVDLFFVLSGFVIAHAYDDRLAHGMKLGRFVLLRLIRLLPMIAIGASIGGALLLAQANHPLHEIVAATLLNAVALPVPSWRMFPTNVAEWSVFCEIVANIVFAATFSSINRRALIAIVALCGGSVMALTISYGDVHHGAGPGLLLFDFLRVGYSFFLGVLLMRTRHAWQSRLPQLPSLAVLGLTALFLFVPAPGVLRTVYDIVALGIGSPLLVMLGSVARSPRRDRHLATISAQLSYPLYAIHFPVFRWVSLLCEQYGWPVWPTNVVAVLALLPVSYALARYYDAPMRQLVARRYGLPASGLTPQPG